MATQGRRRALGQHFLRDQAIAHAIAEAAIQGARQHQCSTLLEIGPGKGAITVPILERLPSHPEIHSFQVVEKDKDLAKIWQEKHSLGVTTEIADFLELSDEKWLMRTPLAVVSNLPYSAGTAILSRLAKHFSNIPIMVLMFQAEVAQRVRAEPSTKARGSLSIWVQNRWDVKKLIAVPPRAFFPPPEVDSEVIVLTRRESPWVQVRPDPKSEALWESFLKTCFSHRRKMLRSVIPWRNALELSGVDGTKRAEALHWEEWDRLFQAVQQVVKPPTS